MKKIPVECYTRVVGYFRPVTHCNPGKIAEIDDRRLYPVSRIKQALEDRAVMASI
jgi:hypothetical protein